MTALQIAQPTGRYQRSLRRYRFAKEEDNQACPVHGYHNASVDIGAVTEADAHGDNWPHDDPRWPTTCECGYVFEDGDHWQRNDDRIYRLPDGREFIFRGSWGKAAPVGAMARAEWADEWGDNRGEAWQISLPDGHEWITTQPASGGGYWTVTGTPPNITVSPSIFCNPPNGWHGFIRDGQLVPA